MDIKILTYEEFIAKHNKYDGKCECAMPGCNKPAYYEGGDARCWFPVCEEHSTISGQYVLYLNDIKHKLETRAKWDSGDSSLLSLYVRVLELLESRN